jgi:hypothetical protein
MFLTLPPQNDVAVTMVQIRRNGGAQRSTTNKVMVAREGLEPPPLAFFSRSLPVAPYLAPDPMRMAGATALEPAASGVTGRRSNQLNYAPA